MRVSSGAKRHQPFFILVHDNNIDHGTRRQKAFDEQLQDQFPNADLDPGDGSFHTLVDRVVGFVETPAQELDLPLDIRGTTFQHRIWDMRQ